MRKISKDTNQKHPGIPKKIIAAATDGILRHLAFDNSLQPNIISTTSSGKIIIANRAACKLLGYSKKELLTKSRSALFDINERSFKKMLEQRTAEGQSKALVTVIKKSGKPLPCEITSAVFRDENGIENAITTISDRSESILKQINIDTKKEKIVTDNIDLAKSKQKKIDTKNEKLVADNIGLAKAEQKKIDTKKEKIVADNIGLAKAEQKKIDTKNEKIVAANIDLAKAEQKKTDAKKEKVVANNIILAQAKSDTRQLENNEWKKNMGKLSYDVMWDWNLGTGQIYAGDSIEEVFGYKVEGSTVHFKDFIRCLLPQEKNRVEKKLSETLASDNKSWNDSYMVKRQDGSIAFTNTRASIVRDGGGKALRLIGAIQDVSRLQELEKTLKEHTTIKKEQSNIFHLAANLSYDGIWDWNLLTNEFFLGEGFEELFGYNLKTKTGNLADWSNHLHPEDKEAVEKGLQEAVASSTSYWAHAYRFIRADGSIANVYGRASIIRNADGKASRMIGVIHDLSQQKDLKDKLDHEIAAKRKLLSEYKESFKLIFNSSSDVLFDCDLVANEVIISDGYEKEFGHKITSHMTPEENWVCFIHPGDKEAVLQDYLRVLASDDLEWKYSYRFLRSDNSVANVSSSCIILRYVNGKAYRMIGSLKDISKQKVLEERLEQEIKLKEKRIAEAMQDAKDTERSDIGKELHDNINQLLGLSKLCLDMAKRGGKDSEMYLSRTSEYTISAIEEIRKLTKGLTTDIIKDLGLCAAIENIARETMELNPVKISCALKSFMEDSVNDKFKLNVFRIVQEQLNNILKHSRATEVTVCLSQTKKSIFFSISDNGVGFDTGKKYKGIGIDNIKSRAGFYNGIADFISKPGQGCLLSITFPLQALLKKS